MSYGRVRGPRSYAPAITLCVGLLVSGAIWSMPSAHADPAYPPTPPCALSARTTGRPATFTLTGSGLGTDQVVVVSVTGPASHPLGRFHTDPTGAFLADVSLAAGPVGAGAALTATSAVASCSTPPLAPAPPGGGPHPGSGGGGAGNGGGGAGNGGGGAGNGGGGDATGSAASGGDTNDGGGRSASAGSHRNGGSGSPTGRAPAPGSPGSSAGDTPSTPAPRANSDNSALRLPLLTILGVVAGLVVLGIAGMLLLTRRSS